MGPSSRLRAGSMAALLALTLCACNTVNSVTDRFDPGYESIDDQEFASRSAEEYEALLREKVVDEIGDARGPGEGRSEVLTGDDYHYKEYVEYPGGPRGFEIELQPQESRTTPYVADVRLEKIRYATELHRNREAAQQDSNFIRATGNEVRSYEVRNGQWVRTGSLFVAGRTEERVDGEWVATEWEQPEPGLAGREQEGWLSRTWDRLQFWR